MLLHHVTTTQQVVAHLGMIATFELRSGEMVTGRVVAADYEKVYLSRCQHRELDLHEIKQVVTPPPA